LYEFQIPKNFNPYEFQELVKVFFSKDQFQLVETREKISGQTRDSVKQQLYHQLTRLTGYFPPWGILTGVRPVKLAGELVRLLGKEEACSILRNYYYVSPEKVSLLLETIQQQQEILKIESEDVALYLGIPFCPTRCLYCSFPAYQVKEEEIQKYLYALKKEIQYVACALKNNGKKVETIYIGGGTPTILKEDQLKELLRLIQEQLHHETPQEFTLEAGRPDTITKEKLKIMKDFGVDRISINPQTMKAETLKRIGRNHTVEEVERAFEVSQTMGFLINADVIAGLPEESTEDFMDTLRQVKKLDPHNITVHTLSVKRGSHLIEEDAEYHYKQRTTVENMLEKGAEYLKTKGYSPYYLYRQKQMVGALENVGYSLPGCKGWYNIRIMEERQTVVALGAGGISKAYYPKEDRLERIPNVSNYEIYINRIDEMIDRKKKDLFMEGES
jgi:oxygen-independent coproporphyrinogen-3 oxidase